jgi:hypothetical protein
MVKNITCVIKVEVDEDKMHRLGYDNIDDYLNECKFCCYDDEEDDICSSVEEYMTDED